MNKFLYDGTPEGLISAIAAILDGGGDPAQAHLAVRQDTLFEEGLFLRTDSAAAESLFEQLRDGAGGVNADRRFYEMPGTESEGVILRIW